MVGRRRTDRADGCAAAVEGRTPIAAGPRDRAATGGGSGAALARRMSRVHGVAATIAHDRRGFWTARERLAVVAGGQCSRVQAERHPLERPDDAGHAAGRNDWLLPEDVSGGQPPNAPVREFRRRAATADGGRDYRL